MCLLTYILKFVSSVVSIIRIIIIKTNYTQAQSKHCQSCSGKDFRNFIPALLKNTTHWNKSACSPTYLTKIIKTEM